MTACDYCRQEFQPTRPNHRFCKDACRAAWNRENRHPGIVKGLRALKNGWSVTVYYPSQPVGINIGSRVAIETCDIPRTDANPDTQAA